MIGKIYITGLIGSIGDEKGVELIDVISQVRKQPEATSFEVHINSEGGVVETGFDIYNYITSLGLPITTIGQGLVASIATVIFMAGNKRIIKENTDFMIHLPMGGIDYATSEEMEMHSKYLKEVENNITNFYTKHLNINKEAIIPLLRNETWLNNEQLYTLGFVNSNSDLKISARAVIKSNKSKKSNMSKKNTLKAILNKLFLEDKVVNKVIFTADEGELNFPNVPEDGVIEVGETATYNGQSAEGEITGQDGMIYVFEGGVLQGINDPSEDMEDSEDVSSDDILDALAATVELAVETSEKVDTLTSQVTGLKNENTELENKLKLAQETIAKLKGESKEVEENPKDKEVKKDTVSSKIANWKKNKNKLKK